MPNLIHFSDATFLSMLYTSFINQYTKAQFYSIHGCFGVTCDKVFILKTLLASVYTDLFSKYYYLHRFDKSVFYNLTNYKIDFNQ